MTFSSSVKEELCKILYPEISANRKFELFGSLMLARKFDENSCLFVTENLNVCKRVATLLAEELDVISDLTINQNLKKNNFLVSIPFDYSRKKLINFYDKFNKEYFLNQQSFLTEQNIVAFLRGIFLICGTVTNPEADYHLELRVSNLNLAETIKKVLLLVSELNLNIGILKKKNAYLLYIKGSDAIADVLTFIGAPSFAMEIMQVKMLKEVRNDINRTTNFEAANISKTATAAAKQITAINEIGLHNLPIELQEIANLRLLYPDMPLCELGKKLQVPITKSGVNHKFKKIIELYKAIDVKSD